MAVAEAHPADARRQALEADAPPRHVEPIVQMRIVRHQLLDLGVGLVDIFRVARQRGPAERPDAAAEQRPDVGGHEAGKIERVAHPLFERHLADVVAVVDGRDARVAIAQHRAHVLGHRRLGGALDALRVAGAPFLPLLQRPALGQIAVDGIVRRGLVGDDVGPDAAAHQLGHRPPPHCRGAPTETGFALLSSQRSMISSASSRSSAGDVDVAGAQAEFDARAAGIRPRAARRRPSSPPAAARRPCRRGRRSRSSLPARSPPIMLAAHFDEGLVGALHDALAADVDP